MTDGPEAQDQVHDVAGFAAYTEEHSEIAEPILAAAVEQLVAAGVPEGVAGHALVSAGLCRLADTRCAACTVTEFAFVRGWIDERILELRGEAH